MLSFTELAVTVADADAYASDRAWSNWTGDNTAKTAALRRGQDFIAGAYNGRWNVEFDNVEAPDAVKFAIIEAARRELVAPGSLNPDYDPSGSIKRERKKLGPLEKEFEYATPANAAAARPIVGSIDALLAGLLLAAPGGTTVTTLARF
jgi:hypothetical protein